MGSTLGRYRIEELVSSGSSAAVFNAQDDHREVTVKVLSTDLGSDAEFAARFDRVMQATSALSHPTIQAVFDWGWVDLDGVPHPYVVSERLVGGSLRDVYDRGRRLSPSQALALGLDVSRGLDHAHRRNFFHGELSPSKLVFGADRRVRIIDLGISQLLADQWWADPSSLPTHMARYASPEQALGDAVGPPTDIYSLCLCLIEGVTADLPFIGDSTQSTLQARIGRLMPVSADLGPLAAVLERAGRPEPDERYSAAQFGRALMEQAAKLPRPEPIALVGSGLFDATPAPGIGVPPVAAPPQTPAAPTADVVSDEAETAVEAPVSTAPLDPAFAISAEVAAQATADDATDDEVVFAPPQSQDQALYSAPEDSDEVAPPPAEMRAPAGLVGATAARSDATVAGGGDGGDGGDGDGDGGDDDDGGSVRSRWLTRVVVPLALIVALAGLGLLAFRLFSTPSYEVPDLAGLTTTEALAEVDDLGWILELAIERSDLEPRPDHVVRTVPGPGQRLSRGEPFLIVASEGPEFRDLPVLTGLSQAEAVSTLEALALVPELDEAFDEDTPLGEVIRWSVPSDPELSAGDQVLPGTEVLLVISLGPAPRTVPDLFASPEAAAVEQLEALALAVEFTDPVFSDEAPAGTIASQTPPPGTEVARGSVIQLAISKGPDLVIFPDLSGTTFEEAQQLLAERDLEAVLEFGTSSGRFLSASVGGSAVSTGEAVPRFSRVGLVFL